MSASISVIIPAYKVRKFLPECLESVATQTLQPEEIIVIDDASPETVDDIVSMFAARPGYPPIRLLKHDTNRGQAAARNTGIRHAKGELLAFLDSDDVWDSRHLENVSGTLLQQNADLAFCPALLFRVSPDEPGKQQEGPMTPEELAIRPLALLRRCFIVASSTIVRSHKLKEIDGFDESEFMRGVEDLDCYMKLLRAGAVFQMAPEATLFYRKHPDSATGRLGYLSRQNIQVKARHIDWPVGSPKEKQSILIDSYWHAAATLWRAGAADKLYWLLMACKNSVSDPILGIHRFHRFLRAMRRHNCLLRR